MSVKFLKKYGTYNEGETATFTPEREADLVKRKVAVSVVVPPKHSEEDELAKSAATGGGGEKKNPEGPQNRQTTGTSSKQK